MTDRDILSNVRIMAASPARENWIGFMAHIQRGIASDDLLVSTQARRWQRAINRVERSGSHVS